MDGGEEAWSEYIDGARYVCNADNSQPGASTNMNRAAPSSPEQPRVAPSSPNQSQSASTSPSHSYTIK